MKIFGWRQVNTSTRMTCVKESLAEEEERVEEEETISRDSLRCSVERDWMVFVGESSDVRRWVAEK
jgi:hypothetical protein